MKTLKIGAVVAILLTTVTLGTSVPVQIGQRIHAKSSDIDCLAKNIYHEARGESVEGQIAVAQVTVNRVKSGAFQSSICNAVYADRQFSWTIGKPKKIKDIKAWQASVAIATAVLTKSIHLPDFKALYFHTRQVNPRWNRNKRVIAKIGNHIFYA